MGRGLLSGPAVYRRARLAVAIGLMAGGSVALAGSASADPNPVSAVALADPVSYGQVVATMQQQRAQAEAYEAYLEKPEMEAKRQESRTQFRNQRRDKALNTLKDEHGRTLEELKWPVSRLQQDDAIDSYLSDYVARVEVAGRRQLIESMVPLRVPDEAGNKRPVDLTLVPSADGFVVRAPLVEVELPADISDGVGVGTGDERVELVPIGAQDAAQAIKIDGDSALWANAAPDADVVATVVPEGVETFTHLRSPASPEELRLAVQATGAITLSELANGEIEVRRDGRRIGRVAKPWAKDAQDQSVEVDVSIESNHLVLNVPHRGKDFAYPILVDPLYHSEDWFGNGSRAWYHGHRTGLDHWDYVENPANWYRHGTRCLDGTDCWGSGDGLYIYTYPGLGYSQASLHFAEYFYSTWDMLNRTTYIPRAEFGYQRSKWYGAGANIAAISGIWNPTGANWTGYHVEMDHGAGDLAAGEYNTTWAGENIASPNVGAGKQAVLAAVPMGNSHPAGTTTYTGSALIYLDDPEYPGLWHSHSAKPPTDRWVRDFSDRITATARDAGTGVMAFNFYTGSKVRTSWQPNERNVNDRCYGTKGSPCFVERTSWHDYNAADLGEGEHVIAVCAYDALAKPTCTTPFTVKVDRTAPTMEPSGALWNARVGGPQPTAIVSGDYQVAFTASDARSGVAATGIKLNGTTVAFNAGAAATWTLDPVTLPDTASHTIAIATFDNAFNIREEQFVIRNAWVSRRYGGANLRLDTTAELNAVEALLDGFETNSSAFDNVWYGLSAADQISLRRHVGHSVRPDDFAHEDAWTSDPEDTTASTADADSTQGEVDAYASQFPRIPFDPSLPSCWFQSDRCGLKSCPVLAAIGVRNPCVNGKVVPRTPDKWLSQIKQNPDTGARYSSANYALRRRLGTPPADQAGNTKGWAAHHVIAAYHRRAVWTRIMAVKCAIHPNSIYNGIYLRNAYRAHGENHYYALSGSLQRRAYHPRLHTVAYFEWVNALMLEVAGQGTGCSSAAAIDRLDRVKDKLEQLGEAQIG